MTPAAPTLSHLGVVPQDHASYTPAEHSVWRTLYQRQMELLPRLACTEFADGLQRLPLSSQGIPNFDELSEVLHAATGWRVVAVPGLLPDDVFFTHLAHRRFPAGRFIRSPQQLDYLQEPDVFHDVFGHVPMLMNPVMADFMQQYGEGGLRAQHLGHLHHLARVYWYTVEFGLVRQGSECRLYGAGIASSFAESTYSLHSPKPQRLRFQLQRVMRTAYRIDDVQACYFVLDRFSDLLALATTDFAPLYQALATTADLQPTDTLPTDHAWPPNPA